MKLFIKKILVIVGLFLSMAKISAQVGVVKNNSDQTAALDLTSNLNKGLLIPRISLNNTTDIVTVPNPVASMLIYNTKADIAGAGALGVGYYYYDGVIWKKLITLDDTDDNLGNHIAIKDLNMGDNKIYFNRADGLKLALVDHNDGPLFRNNSGWINNTQLGYKGIGSGQIAFSNYSGLNNNTLTERMRLNQKGNLGIGTNTPSEKLQVVGNVYVNDQLTIKTMPSGLTDKIIVMDDEGFFKKAGFDLTGLPKRYDYRTVALANDASASIAVVDLPVYMVTITIGNACGRNGIAAFTVCGNTVSYLGGQARNKI
ncbi:hypothetical protein [Flavobacterium anhuiense]|uniref:hypothetical protein n=1 Tax=Flavobacterium anhuiense TaxID=459526 RepID=UPI003D9767F3